jgi:DNA-binding LytR/AlgR family response regulator
MKAIIIEDEKLSAEHLSNLLKRIDASIEVVAYFDSVKKSKAALEEGLAADVLFLDIHLADGLSFDIFSEKTPSLPIIFTTAYDAYAIKAFKLNSIDYLLKPIGQDELKQAVQKLKSFSKPVSPSLTEALNSALSALHRQYKTRFMVKLGDAIISVRTDEICFFASEDGVTILTTQQRKRYAVDFTLDQLSELVSPDLFFRINRQVLISINSVQKVSAYFNSRLKIHSELLQNEQAIVSRERISDFKAWLDK